MTEHRKPRVAIVFGGRSSEHAISCVTAGSVLDAIDRDRRTTWSRSASPPTAAGCSSRATPSACRSTGPTSCRASTATGRRSRCSARPTAPTWSCTSRRSRRTTLGEVDVVFPLLHGPWGEDGTIQGMFEMAGVRYVGAGVLASAVGMDKAYTKVVLEAAGLPVMPAVTVTAREWYRDPDGVRHRVRRPRASRCSSSRPGPGRAWASPRCTTPPSSTRRSRRPTGTTPRCWSRQAAVGAREVECGVLEALDGTPETSVPAEIRVGGEHEFYDFAAKYLPEEHTELEVPADLAGRRRHRAARAGGRAPSRRSAAEGLARVDFFVMPDGPCVINEINTMPGFTPDLDVPPHVGGHRARLPRAGRPAHPARAASYDGLALGASVTRVHEPGVLLDHRGELDHGRRQPVGTVRRGHGHLHHRAVAARSPSRRRRTGR